MPARRKHYDSVTLIELDRRTEEFVRATSARALPLVRGTTPTSFADACSCSKEEKATDARAKGFSDPGHEHGASIKCPSIYEALRKKGMSKEKAARISNSRC